MQQACREDGRCGQVREVCCALLDARTIMVGRLCCKVALRGVRWGDAVAGAETSARSAVLMLEEAVVR